MATGVAEPLPPSSSTPHSYSYPPIIIILTIVLLLFFFAGFFSIYFCRCFMHNLLCTWHFRHTTNTNPDGGGAAVSAVTGTGLDPSIVKSFPTFTYSTVKDYRKEKYGLECAICLIEFRSSDVLRLLTACCHVFHQECVDLWLESHKTCPVCRRNLNSPMQSPVKSPPRLSTTNMAVDHHDGEADHAEAAAGDSHSITIKDDNEGEEESSLEKQKENEGAETESDRDREKFTRSHSTGHSMRNGGGGDGGDDRFTLILPEEVKWRIIRGHNSSKSWTSFGEYNKHTSSKKAEASGVAAGDDKV